MSSVPAQPSAPLKSETTIRLSPEEIVLINLLREKKHQEVVVKVQDGVIVYLERKEKFIRSKGGLG